MAVHLQHKISYEPSVKLWKEINSFVVWSNNPLTFEELNNSQFMYILTDLLNICEFDLMHFAMHS